MKIYIGKYKNTWISPYVILEKFFWFRKNYDAHENRPPKWLQTICEWNVNFLDTINPRIEFVKIDKYDVWDFPESAGKILLPMLKEVRKQKQGSPCVDDCDVPDHLKSMNSPRVQDEWDVDDNFHKRFEWVLDEMIFSFESLSNNWEKQFRSGESDFVFEDNGIGHGPNHTMVVDYDGMKIYQKRIQNGFRLFGLYYLTLWT